MENPDEKEVKKANILIVEDSEIQAVTLKKLLARNGYDSIIARNGAEGISMARTYRAALVIADILMPVMDGYRMTKEIKNDPALRHIPVILLTQLAEVEEVISGLDCGADSYVIKPYDDGYLLSRIKSTLRNPSQFKNNTDEKVTEFEYENKRYAIRSGRGQTMSFLLSTYENAVIKNKTLLKAQEQLQLLNEQLEKKVLERTSALTAEVAERKYAEKGLRESEDRYRAVTESAGDAIVCIDDADVIYLWNRKAEEIFGFTAAEALGKKAHEMLVPEKYRKQANTAFERFVKTGTGPIIGKVVELTALRKDGTEFPVELSISAMKVKDAWHSTGIVRDVTSRRKMQDVLRRSEEKFRSLIESTSDWVWETDESGVYTYASPKIKDLLGYEPREIIGKSPFDLMKKTEAERVATELNVILNAKKPFAGLENVNLHRDGHSVILETSGVPVFDAQGRFSGYRGIDRDVTERRRAEKAIRASEEKYKRLVENLKERFFFYLRGVDGMLTYLSPSVTNILGYAPEEFRAHYREYLTDNVINKEAFANDGASHPARSHGMMEFFHKDGSTCWLEVTEVPVYDADGRVDSVEGIAHDVTEFKKAEIELKERFNELELFHKVTVDREIRMHEVMGENEKLKETVAGLQARSVKA